MLEIKEVLEIAGAVGYDVRLLPWVGLTNCFEIKVQPSMALDLWHKLSAVSDRTGYSPVLAAQSEAEEWDFSLGEELEVEFPHSSAADSPAAGGTPQAAVPPELSSGFQELAEQIRKKIAAGPDEVAASQADVANLTSPDKLMAALNRGHDPATTIQDAIFNNPLMDVLLKMPNGTEIVGAMAKNMEIVSQMIPRLGGLLDDYQKVKIWERNALSLHGQTAGFATFADIIRAGIALDIEEWFAVKNMAPVEIGNFDKQKFRETAPDLPGNLILLPVAERWQIPALLRLGNWNENPPAHIHVAILNRWKEKYGANLLKVGNDSMILYLETPLSNKETALDVAREQHVYCPDNILQGIGDGTYSGAAIELLDSKYWHFWWD